MTAALDLGPESNLTRQRARLADRGDDFYETPACATAALLRVEAITGPIWEPCCGRGAIAKVLRANGFDVWATELREEAYADTARVDFLMERQTWIGSIVTNPPFKLADQFVRHALLLCPQVYMLLRLAFLESERRSDILDSGWLKRVYVFRNRLPMMHRDGWTGPRASSSIPFAWFCFDREHRGPIELHRISWQAQPDSNRDSESAA